MMHGPHHFFFVAMMLFSLVHPAFSAETVSFSSAASDLPVNTVVIAENKSGQIQQRVIAPAQGNQSDFTVVFTLSNCTKNRIQMPSVAGLNVENHSSTININIENGEMTQKVTESFHLYAAHPGDFTIPAFDIRAQSGQIFQMQAIQLHAADKDGTSMATLVPDSKPTAPSPASTSVLGQEQYTPSRQEVPSDYGEKQLRLLLQDRPQLQPIVQKGNKIWDWLQAAFGDTSQGYRIRWDPRPSMARNLGKRGESSPFPDKENISYVLVERTYETGSSTGLDRPPEEVLSDLVFELCNVRHGAENRELFDRVNSGTISREDYIRATAQIEYLAKKERENFYNTVWVPFCQAQGFPYKPHLWQVRFATFDEWLSQYPRDSEYPWRYYGDRYDSITIMLDGWAKVNRGDWDGAIDDCNRVIAFNFKSPDAYYTRGLAYKNKGDYDKAIADFDQALLRSDQKVAEGYDERGKAYQAKGDYEKASADFSQVILLDPKDGEAYVNRGFDYDHMGDHDKAIADYDQAYKLDPEYALNFKNMATTSSLPPTSAASAGQAPKTNPNTNGSPVLPPLNKPASSPPGLD